MNKLICGFLIVICFSGVSVGQEFNPADFIQSAEVSADFMPDVSSVVKSCECSPDCPSCDGNCENCECPVCKCDCPDCPNCPPDCPHCDDCENCSPDCPNCSKSDSVESEAVGIDLDNIFLDETAKRLEEMREIEARMRKLAEEFESRLKATSSDALYQQLESRIFKLEEDSKEFVTKDVVKELVKEEVSKQLNIVTKSATGEVKTQKVTVKPTKSAMVHRKVSVPGHVGTFNLAPGEVLVSVNGQKVRNVSSSFGYSNNYLYSRSNSTYRISQPSCVDGSCSPGF